MVATSGYMNRFVLSLLVLLTCAFSARAEEPAAPQQIDQLRNLILENPDNMDYRYAYANAAAQTGNLEEAARSLEYMLKKHPNLPRVKLELAVLKMRMEEFEESQTLFKEVLAINPPEQVKETIEKMMTAIEKQSATHSFSGGVQVGMNFDTNANSSSSTGQNTFIDINVPLAPDSRKQKDHHKFGAATLAHSYKFNIDKDTPVSTRWNSSISSYFAEYDDVKSLDLGAYSFRTGPAFTVKDTGTVVALAGNYNYIRLDDDEYMRQSGFDGTITQPIGDQWSVSYSSSYEDRNFAATYDDRSGRATQQKIGINYALTQQDIFNLGLMIRRESTKQEYYDNNQREISAGYTRVLPWDMILSFSANYKISDYDQPDPLVSATTVREDHEKGLSASLSVPLVYNIVWNSGYQYRNVHSTLQNYEYNNHRVSTSIGWQF